MRTHEAVSWLEASVWRPDAASAVLVLRALAGTGGMSRPDTEGFSIMDVSTAIVDDERFQLLARVSPDHFEAAFMAYMATLARSWRKGRRISIQQSWPVYRPIDQLAVDALVHVGLIDGKGLIRAATWRQWFDPAQIRRDSNRDKWRKDKATQRNTPVSEHESPRGVHVESARSPRIPTVRPSVPTEPSDAGAAARGDAPRRGAMTKAADAAGGFVGRIAAQKAPA